MAFIIATVVRLAWVAMCDGPLMWEDEQDYVNIARHLVAGDGYVSASYRATPLLPAYLAVVFRLFGERYDVARVGQAIAGAVTVVLVGGVARRVAGLRVGIASAMLLAVYLPQVYLSGVFYAECLFTLLLAATLYGAIRILDAERPLGWAVATGVAFGLGILARPIGLVAFPGLCAALVWAGRFEFRRGFAICGTLTLAVALPIAPWTLRNYAVYGRPILVATGFGTTLWQGNNELTQGDADDRFIALDNAVWRDRLAAVAEPERSALAARYAAVQQQLRVLTDAAGGERYLATDPVLGALARDYILTHPLRTLRLFARKLLTLVSPFSGTVSQNQHTGGGMRFLAALSFLPLAGLAAIGVALAGVERRFVVIYAVVGSIVIAYGLLDTCTRFRLPLDPWIIVLAALTLERCTQWWAGVPATAPWWGGIELARDTAGVGQSPFPSPERSDDRPGA